MVFLETQNARIALKIIDTTWIIMRGSTSTRNSWTIFSSETICGCCVFLLFFCSSYDCSLRNLVTFPVYPFLFSFILSDTQYNIWKFTEIFFFQVGTSVHKSISASPEQPQSFEFQNPLFFKLYHNFLTIHTQGGFYRHMAQGFNNIIGTNGLAIEFHSFSPGSFFGSS